MKKLISIGVALALLVTFMVPVAVAADDIVDPGTYSKTPFGILGSGLQLVGSIVNNLAAVIDGFLPVDLGLTATDLSLVIDDVGGWTGVELAWMTDMTAWSMVTAGDMVGTVLGVPFIANALGETDLTGIEDVFYVLSARLWDPWGVSNVTATLPDVIITDFPPGLGS